MMELNIVHLYPDVLNLYGDRGNIYTMMKRLQWRGIDVSVKNVKIGEKLSLSDADIVFIGGGQDFEQEVLLSDLRGAKAKEIISAIEDGKTFLTICGGYQMLGNYYETHEGVKCDFIGALDFYTKGADIRMIGNYMFRCAEEHGGSIVVGFENHSGKTYLGSGVKPLGTILAGFGNNGEDQTEGVAYKNTFGTYSHGPILPKNPFFCDLLLSRAMEHKYGISSLSPLNDAAELLAHDEMQARLAKA